MNEDRPKESFEWYEREFDSAFADLMDPEGENFLTHVLFDLEDLRSVGVCDRIRIEQGRIESTRLLSGSLNCADNPDFIRRRKHIAFEVYVDEVQPLQYFPDRRIGFFRGPMRDSIGCIEATTWLDQLQYDGLMRLISQAVAANVGLHMTLGCVKVDSLKRIQFTSISAYCEER